MVITLVSVVNCTSENFRTKILELEEGSLNNIHNSYLYQQKAFRSCFQQDTSVEQ